MAKIPVFSERTAKILVKVAKDYRGTVPTNNQRPKEFPLPSKTYRNDNAEPVPPYGCMRVIDAEEDPDTGRYVIVIDKPNGTGGPFLFNGAREVEKFGQAFSGVVKAAYSTGTPEVGQIWGPKSTWEIEAAGDPAVLVYGSLADQELIIGSQEISTAGVVLGKMSVPISFGETATAEVWSSESPPTNTGETAEVTFDWFPGDPILAGKQVAWVKSGSINRLMWAEC